ncbi:MAG: 1,4-dihydroxy-2-naphthoate octaprenyltransferase [Bacteroidales bacterium]|nr:1,4-dihydroxy-2-naphthoate octaprenyltransferase [Bacteroidales bacterium]
MESVSARSKVASWVEAMRLRTLPVSVAGVLAGTGCAVAVRSPRWGAAALCLVFAILAQIASNFANEYFDYKDGLDRPGRVGPRRGVTEGDITPQAMKLAVGLTLGLACCVGLGLVVYGGWWLIGAGAVIAFGALAYSAGPYPLSRHALGEVAVILFFGVIPVSLTYYVQTDHFSADAWLTGVAIGLMGANILIVNNYRDVDDDAAVGKTTLAVRLGRRPTAALYLANGIVALALMWEQWARLPHAAMTVPGAYLALHLFLWSRLMRRQGRSLNPLLGMTAMLMAAYALGFLLFA